MPRQYSFRTPTTLYQEYLDYRSDRTPADRAAMDAAFEEFLNLFCDSPTVTTNDPNQPDVPPADAIDMQVTVLPLRFIFSVHHANQHVWIHGITYQV